jgi:hypothetical protein
MNIDGRELADKVTKSCCSKHRSHHHKSVRVEGVAGEKRRIGLAIY